MAERFFEQKKKRILHPKLQPIVDELATRTCLNADFWGRARSSGLLSEDEHDEIELRGTKKEQMSLIIEVFIMRSDELPKWLRLYRETHQDHLADLIKKATGFKEDGDGDVVMERKHKDQRRASVATFDEGVPPPKRSKDARSFESFTTIREFRDYFNCNRSIFAELLKKELECEYKKEAMKCLCLAKGFVTDEVWASLFAGYRVTPLESVSRLLDHMPTRSLEEQRDFVDYFKLETL